MPSKAYAPSDSRASHPFEKIHSDLKEFSVPSYHKYRYYMSFFDDYTSYGWTVLLRHKSDAIKALRQFVAMVETQFETKIRQWQSDAGGEYKSEQFDDFLRDRGIEILTSLPYVHQQNGRAERFNRTIMEKAQSMRLDACIPQSWWEFAVNHAVHVYNRTPMSRLKWKTPFELLHGKKPDISHLRVFGCGAYVYLPREKRANKLAPRAELMTYLGVPEGVKGYLFMRPNNTLFNAGTAQFIENMFPKCLRPSDHVPTAPDQFPPSDDESPNGMDDGDDAPVKRHRNIHPPSPSQSEQSEERDDAPAPRSADKPPGPPSPAPAADDDNQEDEPPLRRSGRPKKVPKRPDNVYGETRHPTEVEIEIERGGTWNKRGGKSGSSRSSSNKQNTVPGPSSQNPVPSDQPLPFMSSEETWLANIAQEGGVDLLNYLLMKAIPDSEEVVPVHYKDIFKLPEEQQKQWLDACREEIEALRKRGVYELVDLPKGRKAIKNRWVFSVKPDKRKRSRLVAKGFQQKEGVDYEKIFSPVVRYETVRLMLALAALEGWHLQGLDVKTAFLYGSLDEEIYMEQPEGFKAPGKEHKVWRLKRALYGLKQASLAWWRELTKSMKKLGFTRVASDAGVFVYKGKNGERVYAIVYVDDALFLGPDLALVLKKKSEFMQQWECRDLGEAKEFLGIRIRRDRNKIVLDQKAYLQKVLERFGMTNAKPHKTPLPHKYQPLANTGEVDSKLRTRFQSVIGSLLYLMLGTRPDIAFAVIKLSQFSANPSEEHLKRALGICHYLVGTPDYILAFDGDSQKGLVAYTDSDWAEDRNDRRSISGFFMKLADCVVLWQSRAQKTVAGSSTEAEYMALSDGCRQVMWVQSLFKELGFNETRTPLCGDNQGSLFISSNPVQERRTKHIDIKYHYIREKVENGDVEVFFVPSDDNPADLMTKALSEIKFRRFLPVLGMSTSP